MFNNLNTVQYREQQDLIGPADSRDTPHFVDFTVVKSSYGQATVLQRSTLLSLQLLPRSPVPDFY